MSTVPGDRGAWRRPVAVVLLTPTGATGSSDGGRIAATGPSDGVVR